MKSIVSDAEYMEMIVIGSILTHPDIYPLIAEVVKPRDFACDSAAKCWGAIASNFSASDNKDLYGKVYISLPNDIDKQWFFKCTNDILPLKTAAVTTAKQVAELARARRITAELAALTSKAKSTTRPDHILEDLLSLYRRENGEVDHDVSIGSVIERFKVVQEKYRKQGSVGKRTGFEILNRDFIVYQPGHLWVIGGWTSSGKTAWMIESLNRFFAENEHGKVAVFSTEMTEEQNVARMLANRTGVNANVILSGQMLDTHRNKTEAEIAWLAGKELYIYSKTRNIDDLMSQCRKLKHSGGVDMVWIDFIQNVYRAGVSDQYAMMSQIAKDLQALAHDLGCTVVALSQIPNHAGREDSGILEYKGAGEIAAACDIGAMLKRGKEDNSQLLFDVRKNRHGKCGKYLFQFAEGWTRIIEKEAIDGQ